MKNNAYALIFSHSTPVPQASQSCFFIAEPNKFWLAIPPALKCLRNGDWYGNRNVIEAAIAYFENDIRRISHLLKVYGFAKAIGEKEQLDLFTMECLETAAVLHDIGIKISEEKYQSSAGKYQELEGPPVAAVILKKLEFPAPVTERVAYLIGHHHTYDKIEGMDYQILVEADFLVNINEDGLDSSKQGLDSIRKIKENIFKTKTGTKILESIYLSKVN